MRWAVRIHRSLLLVGQAANPGDQGDPKAAGPAMACKLLEAAQDRRRAVNGPTWPHWVRAGARFEGSTVSEAVAASSAVATPAYRDRTREFGVPHASRWCAAS
jgi:hypothetical protein